MFVARDLSSKILAGAKQVPVIAVTGPRQAGKSTLIKELFSNHFYIDMQDADSAQFAKSDPKGFLSSYATEYGIIIDEAQYVPELFPQIKVEADKNPRPGYYILSGSQNFLLHEKISESLAGRAYFYHLLPYSIAELKEAKLLRESPDDQIMQGFYPRVYYPHIDTVEYYKNYLATYVERDIKTLRNVEDLLLFQKFLQICALRIGTTIHYNDLAVNTGISVATAKSWLSLLQTSFILFQLPSYHDNLGKRITKSPKLYFYDVGLAANILNLDKEALIKQRTVYGALFENMIIVDVLKNMPIDYRTFNLTFFRESNQKEIDLIIEADGQKIPVEIKASETITSNFFDTGHWFSEVAFAQKPIVIYGGKHMQKRSYGQALSWTNTKRILS